MGAFNAWTRGSFLEKPENRSTITVAMNLLFGACVLIRAGWLRCQGYPLSSYLDDFSPLPLDVIVKHLR